MGTSKDLIETNNKIGMRDLPLVNNGVPKTSFECKPYIPKSSSLISSKNGERRSVPERHYGIDDSEFVKDWNSRRSKIKNVRCIKI